MQDIQEVFNDLQAAKKEIKEVLIGSLIILAILIIGLSMFLVLRKKK